MLRAPDHCPSARDAEEWARCVIRAIRRDYGTDGERKRSESTYQETAEVIRLEGARFDHRLRRRCDEFFNIEIAEPSDGADHGSIGAANDISAPPMGLEAQRLRVVAAGRIACRGSPAGDDSCAGFRRCDSRRRMTYRLGAGCPSTNQGADQKRPKNSRFH